MTETLPLTVFDVKGPIFIGESPALKFMGKVKWDSPFLKQVTDEGIGVAVDIVIFQLNAVVPRFCAKRVSGPPRFPCNVYDDDSWGHSMTTWTQSCSFLTTTYLYVDIFNPERGQK